MNINLLVFPRVLFSRLSLGSDESPERSASPWKRDPGDAVQTPGGAAAAAGGGAGGADADSGLLRLRPPSLQEARLQELQQHLPAVGDAAPVQHPVRLRPLPPAVCCPAPPHRLSLSPSSSVSEDTLKDLFSSRGFPVKAFKFFQ